MRNIIAYFIKYPVSGNVILVLLFIFGYVSLTGLKKTFFPEQESRFINIQCIYPGSSPSEIEQGIVLKIEDNLEGVTGIERVTSTSSENTGSVSVEVAKSYDPDLILQDVKNAVDRISSFPSGMEPPTVYRSKNIAFAINFAISGDVPLKTLKNYARQAENELLNVEGISQVSLSGFPDEEIEISFREQDLRAYNLTFDQATQAIRASNIEVTGGTIKTETEELLVRANTKEYYADDFRDIIVKVNPDGTRINLGDIANVEDKWADNPNKSFMDGERSAVVSVNNTLSEDILFITDTVHKYIEDFNEKNEVVKATVIRDSSISLNQRIELLSKNGIIGFLLVLILLALFLNYRLAFWVALSIPISFAGMFVIGGIYGLTINVISLFGMILVIGILVDDGIVIAENIFQHYEMGKDRITAAIDGTMEVLPAVFAAIITTILAFSTFFFVEGRLGDFFSEVAFVVMATLFFSLVEGALILPAHVAHSKALNKGYKENIVTRSFDRFMKWLRDKIYAPILRFSLKNKLFALSIPIAMFLVTLGAMSGGIIKFTFFPRIERDTININLTMPAGTRENITEQWLDHLEHAVWAANEELIGIQTDSLDVIMKVEKNVGPTSYDGRLSVGLLAAEKLTVRSSEISQKIREKAGTIYGAEKLTFGGGSTFGDPVAISLFGSNKKELDGAIEEIKNELKQMTDLKDVQDSNQEGLREVNISLKEKARILGLTPQIVLSQVRAGFFGSEVQRLQRGLDEVKVWVRYENEDRSSVGKLEDMRIRLANGQEYALGEVADFKIERGIVNIKHLDGQREIRITSDVKEDVSVTEVMTDIQTNIVPQILQKYPSVTAGYEGQNRQQAKSVGSMQAVLPVILILMLSVIVLTFRSFWQMILIVILIPFGFIGVGWGHYLHGHQISLLSILGIIALVGILVNDALVFVTSFNQNMRAGKPFMEAVHDTALSRFRPILLTTVTTVIGLVPLILEKSFQAKFLIPMAISISYGLLMITIIILVILPVLLVVLNMVKRYLNWAWEGELPTQESVEPAVQELAEQT